MRHKGSSILILTIVCSWASSLDAQENAATEKRLEGAVLLIPRFSTLEGRIDKDDDFYFGELWDSGFGISLEGDFLCRLGKKSWKLGGYAQLGCDLLAGGDEGGVGNELEADDLLLTHFMFGAKIMHAPERGLFFDARLGAGLVHYQEADGELRVGGVTTDVTIFDSTTGFAWEMGTHLGYSGGSLFVAAGVGFRAQRRPDESDDFDFEGTNSPILFMLEFEIGYRF